MQRLTTRPPPLLQDLHCPGAAEDGVGCTACPGGMKRQLARPSFIAGSQLLQAQPQGYGCY